MSHALPQDFSRHGDGESMEFAVLDLGSTTFHLQHICVDAEGHVSTRVDEKRSTCLGAQVFVDGFLNAASWLESLQAFSELLELSRRAGADQRVVVATSAIRSATNGAELVREIEQQNGVRVRVLSPEDEAWLAYLGQATSPVVAGRRIAAIDLGGGSVEVAVGEGTRCLHVASLPMGAVRIRTMTAATDYDAAQAARVRELVRSCVADTLQAVRELQPEIVVFGSGSARAARKLLLRDSALPGKTGPIETHTFQASLTSLLGRSPAELMQLGVESARASTVLVSATIMIEMLDALGAKFAVVSDKGLRDGIVFELQRDHASQQRLIQSASAFA
jgi:exopolyphosphatase/guanosine-5'-triphosphate,3'-diphosphate pyrophosphatase